MTISQRPDLYGGQPFIEGTEVPVISILRALDLGKTPEEIVELNPVLTIQNVREAQLFAELLQGFIEADSGVTIDLGSFERYL